MPDGITIFTAKYLWLAVVMIAVVWWPRQPRALRQRVFWFGLISLPLTYLLGLAARQLYYSERPFVVGNFTPLIPHAADNGFPSDHLLLLSALATVVFGYDRRWGTGLWLLVLLIGWARVAAGVHHWVDILGAAVSALVIGWLAYYLCKQGKGAQSHKHIAFSD